MRKIVLGIGLSLSACLPALAGGKCPDMNAEWKFDVPFDRETRENGGEGDGRISWKVWLIPVKGDQLKALQSSIGGATDLLAAGFNKTATSFIRSNKPTISCVGGTNLCRSPQYQGSFSARWGLEERHPMVFSNYIRYVPDKDGNLIKIDTSYLPDVYESTMTSCSKREHIFTDTFGIKISNDNRYDNFLPYVMLTERTLPISVEIYPPSPKF